MANKNSFVKKLSFVSKEREQTVLHRFLVGFLVMFVVLLVFSTLTAALSSNSTIALTALKDVFFGIVFGATAKRDGLTLFAVIFSAVMFYLALILCVVGIIVMIKKQHKERILGFVTAYAGIVTSLYFVSVFAEYTFGNGKGTINLFLPIFLLILVLGLYVLIGFDYYNHWESPSQADEKTKEWFLLLLHRMKDLEAARPLP